MRFDPPADSNPRRHDDFTSNHAGGAARVVRELEIAEFAAIVRLDPKVENVPEAPSRGGREQPYLRQ